MLFHSGYCTPAPYTAMALPTSVEQLNGVLLVVVSLYWPAVILASYTAIASAAAPGICPSAVMDGSRTSRSSLRRQVTMRHSFPGKELTWCFPKYTGQLRTVVEYPHALS